MPLIATTVVSWTTGGMGDPCCLEIRDAALVVGGACVDDSCAEGLAKLVRLKQLTVWQPRYVEHVNQGAGDGDSSDNRAASSSDVDGRSGAFGHQLTFRGLRSLMQLNTLTKFHIDPYSSVFEIHCCSSGDLACAEFIAPMSVAVLLWLLPLYMYSSLHLPCCLYCI
jgi:hypothetical protein